MNPTPDLLTAALKARDADLVKRLKATTCLASDCNIVPNPICQEAAQAIIDMAGRIEELEKDAARVKELMVEEFTDYERQITALKTSESTAFTRGAEAMRKMAAKEADLDFDDQGFVMIRPYHEIAAAIRALPLPEDGA